MPSYNLVNGRPCHVSPYLEGELRRWPAGERAGDDLVVCSDAEAPSNLVDAEHYFADHPAGHAAALRAGVDSFTDHGEDSSVTIGRITEALERGLLTVADVDRAVRRLLLLRLRLGEFDPGPRPVRGHRRGLDRQRTAVGGRSAASRRDRSPVGHSVDRIGAGDLARTGAGPPGGQAGHRPAEERRWRAADHAAARLPDRRRRPARRQIVRGLVQRDDALPGHGGRGRAGGAAVAGRRHRLRGGHGPGGCCVQRRPGGPRVGHEGGPEGRPRDRRAAHRPRGRRSASSTSSAGAAT